MAKRFLIGLLAVLAAAMPAFAQSTVSGKIVDTKGEGIPGANVIISGTRTGAISDLDGSYKLTGVSSKAVLEFSCLGYATKKVAVEGKSVINVVLEEDSEFLDDVVVIGYGTARRKDLTGSLSQVDGANIAVQAQGSLSRTLEGQVAGLQVSSVDGQPGVDMGIRIRGIGTASANNSNALIIIDGVPALEGTNVLSSISNKDIESIVVLKDAASTALYGSRGANGVILITTKTGKEGKTKVSFEGKWGINTIGGNGYLDKVGADNPGELYEMYWESIYNSVYYGYDNKQPDLKGNAAESALFASQHLFNNVMDDKGNYQMNGIKNYLAYDVPGMTFTKTSAGTSNESATLGGAYLVGTDGKLNPNAKLLYSGNTAEEALIANRFRQEYNVTASGASDKIDYHLSLGYLSDPSYITWSSFDRYTARANVNAQVTNWLKAGAKFGYTSRTTNSQATRWGRNPGAATQNAFYWVNNTSPLRQFYARDPQNGYSYVYNDAGEKMVTNPIGGSALNGKSWESPVGPVAGLTSYNLVKMFEQAHDTQKYNDMTMSGYARANFLKDFTFEVNLTYNKSFGTRTRFYNTESAKAFVGSIGSAIWKSKEEFSTFNTQQLLSYNKNIGKHHVDAMLGHEFHQYNYDLIRYGSAYSLIDDFEGYVNFLGTQTYGTFGSTTGGNINKYAMESYFGRANYIFDDKYYVSASIRRDGSSKFKKPENRWGTFWSVGAGWRISSEEFMEATRSWLDNLKLRASYGVIGNQNGIGMYSGYQTWSYGGGNWTSGATTHPESTTLKKGGWVNDALTWENVHTTDAGFDFSLFGSKLTGAFDFFNKHTVNAVWGQRASYLAAGQATLPMNTAGIRSRGIEIELAWQPVHTEDWDVLISTNGTTFNTVLTKVPAGTGSDALDGCWTASADGWSMHGAGSSSGSEYLRGVGKDYFNLYLYKYGGVAGNPGKTYFDNDGKSYTGYTKGDKMAGMPLYYHKVTKAEAEAKKFGGAAEGTDILTTDYSIASRYEMGDAIPDWYGGMNFNVRYKNFDLTVLMAYQIGGKFYSVEYGNGMYLGSSRLTSGAAVSSELLGNTWNEDNQSAKFPMIIYGRTSDSGATIGSWKYTDMALFDASYLSLKNITLGYTLPQSLTKKAHISNLRVYVSADNTVLLTGHSGFDPRMSMVGGMEIGAYGYPYLGVYTFGVNLDF